MKNLLRFLIGLLIFGLVHYLIYDILFSYAFEIFPCEDDLLDDRLQHNIVFFTLAGLIIGQAFVSRKLIKGKDYKFSGWAGILLILPAIYFIVMVGPKGLIKSNYYTEFSKDSWGNTENRTEEMIRYTINEEVLLGMTREEIKSELGQPAYYSCEEDSCFVYHTKSEYTPINVKFQDNKVQKVYVICID